MSQQNIETLQPGYKEIKEFYDKYFSLKFFGSDINNKFALISLICYLVYKMHPKNPKITPLALLNKINSNVPDNIIQALAIMCENFGYGCTEFPTFGIEDKKIPAKIKELLKNYVPF